MTAENFDEVFRAMLARRPFRVFTVQLHTGERFEIDHPTAVAHRGGLAIYIAPGSVPHWFDHESVSQVIESGSGAAA